MKIRLWLCLTIGLIVLAQTFAVPNAPSKACEAALEARLPDLASKGSSLQACLHHISSQMSEQGIKPVPGFSIEYCDSSSSPRLSCDIVGGTLKEQLDRLANDVNYVWSVSGAWVNFVLKDQANNPQYIMNQKLSGHIVVSRDNRNTCIREWLSSHKVTTARDVHNVVFAARSERQYGVELTEIDNPTLRDYYNARADVNGDQMWTVILRVYPPQPGETTARLGIIEWSQHTYKEVPAPSDATK